MSVCNEKQQRSSSSFCVQLLMISSFFVWLQLILLKRKLCPRRRVNRDSNTERVWQEYFTLPVSVSCLFETQTWIWNWNLKSSVLVLHLDQTEDAVIWDKIVVTWMDWAGQSQRSTDQWVEACCSFFTPEGAFETFALHAFYAEHSPQFHASTFSASFSSPTSLLPLNTPPTDWWAVNVWSSWLQPLGRRLCVSLMTNLAFEMFRWFADCPLDSLLMHNDQRVICLSHQFGLRFCEKSAKLLLLQASSSSLEPHLRSKVEECGATVRDAVRTSVSCIYKWFVF